MAEETKKYYRPELYCDDGTNIGWTSIEELPSNAWFASEEDLEEWCEDHDYDMKDISIDTQDSLDYDEYVIDGEGHCWQYFWRTEFDSSDEDFSTEEECEADAEYNHRSLHCEFGIYCYDKAIDHDGEDTTYIGVMFEGEGRGGTDNSNAIVERIVIIDHARHEVFIEDLTQADLDKHDGQEENYINANYTFEDGYSWDYITCINYVTKDGCVEIDPTDIVI